MRSPPAGTGASVQVVRRWPDPDFDIATEAGGKDHEALHGEDLEAAVAQGGRLGLVDAEAHRHEPHGHVAREAGEDPGQVGFDLGGNSGLVSARCSHGVESNAAGPAVRHRLIAVDGIRTQRAEAGGGADYLSGLGRRFFGVRFTSTVSASLLRYPLQLLRPDASIGSSTDHE